VWRNSCRDSSICVTWIIHTCDMFICVTCSYVWRDSCANVIWIIHMCDITHTVTHPHGWHDVFGAFSSGTALAATPFRSEFYKCEMTHPVSNPWGWNFKGSQWRTVLLHPDLIPHVTCVNESFTHECDLLQSWHTHGCIKSLNKSRRVTLMTPWGNARDLFMNKSCQVTK